MSLYLWQSPNWPNFTWKSEVLLQSLVAVRKYQGCFLQAMEELGFEDGLRAYAVAVEEDAVQTAGIET
jgi:Fic family protein